MFRGYILIDRIAEGVHGQSKFGRPWSSTCRLISLCVHYDVAQDVARVYEEKQVAGTIWDGLPGWLWRQLTVRQRKLHLVRNTPNRISETVRLLTRVLVWHVTCVCWRVEAAQSRSLRRRRPSRVHCVSDLFQERKVRSKAVVLKLFPIAHHLWVPCCQHVPPCSKKSQCAKCNSIKSLKNQIWHKCNMKEMAVRKYYGHL